MKTTSAPSRAGSGILISIAIAGAIFASAGCSDEPGADVSGGAGGTSGAASGTTGNGGAQGGSIMTGGAGAGGSSTGGAGAGGASGTSGSNSGGAGTAGTAGTAGNMGGAGNAGTAGASGMGGAAGAGAGGAGTSGAGDGGTAGASGAGASGAAGGGGTSAEDFDPGPEDFTCIADWQKVLGFRITNALGKTAEAIAVAEAGTGTYPVGTIIQHLPTEAMVKRRAGFSAETKDWEFFLLQLSPEGVTTIAERGTTEIETSMGDTCVSCHSLAPDEFDFVCNTWGEAGGENCGFDFMDSFLDQQLQSDTRCD